MAEIFIQSTGSIEDAITELTSLLADFRTCAEDIDTTQSGLTKKWEGDASTIFQERYARERQNFETFDKVITDYINKLTEILAEYESAEGKNKEIAAQGNY